MRYLLIDKNPRLVSAWREFFSGYKQVSILEGDLTQVSHDAIVSPANSFGFMDGGVDYAISMRLGWGLQDKVQAKIKALPNQELLVGQALVVPTDDKVIPYLIAAPTMRVPMSFNIDTSVNAYLAMKATILAAKAHPDIEDIAIPGFCTGVGRMDPMIAAKQMFMAFEEIELGKSLDFSSFAEAQKHQWNINPKGFIWEG